MSKLSPIVFLATALVLSVGCSKLASQTEAKQEIGRFQLLHAVIESGDTSKEAVLFKIDTMTGNTWRYNQMTFKLTNGTPVGCDGWIAIGDYVEEYERLTKSVGLPGTKMSKKKQ